MKTLLIVFFMVNGQPQLHPQMTPMIMEGPVACEKARVELTESFTDNPPLPHPFFIGCYQKLPNGELI